jgi:GWxTD domain-containing protein
MDRGSSILALTLLVGSALGPGLAGASGSELSKDDRRWLDQVEVLITPTEVKLFKQIGPDDRERFREIFWARRDPNPWTPRNELQAEFEARRVLADHQFRQGGLTGSMTAMGRVFLLMGPPAQSAEGRVKTGGAPVEAEDCTFCETDPEQLAATLMGQEAGRGEATFMTWRYEPDPCLGIPRGWDVEFRSSTTFGFRLTHRDDVERALDRARRLRIYDTALGYERDAAGRLRLPPTAGSYEDPLAGVLARGGASDQSVSRVTFRVVPSFFAAEGKACYAPLLLEIDPGGLSWDDGVTEVTISGEVGVPDEDPLERFRLRLGLARDPDGRARIDIPLALPPGPHELRVAVQDDVSRAVSTRAVALVVPDFRCGDPVISSVVAFADAREAAAAKPALGRAFQFGRLRLAPRRAFRRDESLGLLFYVYGLDGAAGASPVVQYTLLHDGEVKARTAEIPLSVAGSQAVGNTEIPLQGFAPGHYALQVGVTGASGGLALTRSIEFDVEEPAS